MNEPKSQHDIMEEIRREHEELRALLGDVHQMLAKRVETVAGVSEKLASLVHQVETHFSEEETAGFFDDVIERAPRLSDRIDVLRDEHRKLQAAVRHLQELAGQGDGSADWWQRLDSAFHDFSKELMHHESCESEILLEAYTDDIGAAD